MLAFQRNKEKQRYYLLPGQGGRASRRKQRIFLMWAIIIGLLASAAFAGALYLIGNATR